MNRSANLLACLLALLIVTATPAMADDDQPQPLQVYIMMGQSNMVGFGQIGPADAPGSLQYITREQGLFPYLTDGDGNWVPRDDVWCVQVTAGNRRDWLEPGFGARADFIGPELGFGHAVGNAVDAPVLIIKATMGNRALGWDLMPPSSRTISPEQHENQWYQGWQYDIHIRDIRNVLNNLNRFYPGYADQGYEIAGFAWWQGHKDQSTPGNVDDNWAESYEANLVNLINDLRDEFEAPNAPFVLATIAFGGQDIAGAGLTIVNAQLAVDGESGEHPEFAGNVATVDARPFWRDADASPGSAGYHYNHNAETYMLVGEALGQAMVRLMDSGDANGQGEDQ